MRSITLFIIFYAFNGFSQNVGDTSSNDIYSEIKILEFRIHQLEADENKVPNELSKVVFGLSFGFNGYVNGPKSFYIRDDSTLGPFGESKGVSGMLSALLGYSIGRKHSIYLNVPLSDFNFGNNATLGVFNRKVAGGIGYGYVVGSISFIAVVNIYPYEEPALDILEDKKYDQEPLTLAQLDDIPTVSRISPIITIGVCYHLKSAANSSPFLD